MQTATADEIIVLHALERRRLLGYRYIKALMGGCADRALAAIDHLLGQGDIERVCYGGETHYRLIL